MIKKSNSKTGQSCRVTLELLPEVRAERAHLCGMFNDWDRASHRMTRLKDSGFSVTISLKPGQEYAFRYLLDNEGWQNDATADAQQPNPFGGKNSVVRV
ncbi:MAG: isoamylase early set domain-containing protein [Anaerolineales bacterium]|jgi:1,4-alpha-glucan branching enzyme